MSDLPPLSVPEGGSTPALLPPRAAPDSYLEAADGHLAPTVNPSAAPLHVLDGECWCIPVGIQGPRFDVKRAEATVQRLLARPDVDDLMRRMAQK